MSPALLKKKIYAFLKTHPLAVIATVDAIGRPEAAVIGISETRDLHLYFGTFITYRKYNNLKLNPKVALAIGWDGEGTVQYEGVARELTGKDAKRAQRIHGLKSKSFRKFAKLPEERYFQISPTWIRYTDYSRDDIYGETTELTF